MVYGFGGLTSGVYRVIVLLHILAAIVGFGGVLLNGVYAMEARKRPGPSGRAVSESNFAVSMVAEKVIFAVPLLGLAAVGASDDAWSLGDTWLWLSLVLMIVGLGIAHTVMTPGHRRINQLLAEMESSAPTGGPPPQLVEVQATGRRLGMMSMVLNVLLVTILALMIWKPS